MKLVEILAKELKEWPENAEELGQCYDGDLHLIRGGNSSPEYLGIFVTKCDSIGEDKVTRAQWRAERDRQRGGEWKRHRGGKQPVADDVIVEYKTRSGYTDTWLAKSLSWSHEGSEGDLMKYRVISQPQAEEVGVNIPAGAKLEFAGSVDGVDIKDLDWTVIGTTSSDFSVGQWHQIDGPLKWRDTIIHCQAIIEDCEREIAKNENLLALEGFALITAMTPVAGMADVDMSDWRNWKVGDIVEVILPNDSGLMVGKQYTIKKVEDPEYVFGMPVNVIDEAGSDYWPEDEEGEGRLVFKFIRRP